VEKTLPFAEKGRKGKREGGGMRGREKKRMGYHLFQ